MSYVNIKSIKIVVSIISRALLILELLLQINFHITIFKMTNRLVYQRAQTASPQQRIHIKHQDLILKQIKTMQIISQLQPRCQSQHINTRQSSLDWKNNKKKVKHYSSDLEFQVAQIEKIRGNQLRPFSFYKDQKNICKSGWIDFGLRVEKKTQNDLKKIRKKANQMLKREKVSNICIIDGVKKVDIFQESLVAEQKIKNIWNLVKGTEIDDKYMKIHNLNKDIKNSVVLGNAYKLCLHSKNYKNSIQQDFMDQKFKSFVYLSQNMDKLPRKKIKAILKNNYLLQ